MVHYQTITIQTEKKMALYMMQIKYTLDAIKDIAESGSNREDAVRPLIEKCGGKLISFYGLVGQDHHIVLITEFESLPDYLGMALSGIVGGAIADWKTVQLYSAADMMAATETYRASKDSYAPPPNE
jgi:uncharacterized protein with GYD domain